MLSEPDPRIGHELTNKRIVEPDLYPWSSPVPKPRAESQKRVSHIAPLLRSRLYFLFVSDSIGNVTRGDVTPGKPPFNPRHRTLKLDVGSRAKLPRVVDLEKGHRTVVAR